MQAANDEEGVAGGSAYLAPEGSWPRTSVIFNPVFY